MIKKYLHQILQKISDERGATAIEYGLIAVSISVVIVVTVTSMGVKLDATFQDIVSYL